jgi:hypothetical protein
LSKSNTIKRPVPRSVGQAAVRELAKNYHDDSMTQVPTARVMDIPAAMGDLTHEIEMLAIGVQQLADRLDTAGVLAPSGLGGDKESTGSDSATRLGGDIREQTSRVLALRNRISDLTGRLEA